ncbi:DUF3180 domain-containing protein [Microbacterium sp. No. 7]|uniref:DUF3180 domain-containing protein n=1 Tax=Microbacterium sp. No. 7 TaxID=1714373 RepID=UPI0006CFB4E6|nr:DUF3180 domain-containing protein [Microbacterium sp. No. 7]ALJ22010.1 hypothetical protein AOA12_19775 [Microbacterium sp. No. 7]
MKRTSIGLLVAVAVVGGIVGFVADQLLTSSGRPTFTPSLLLPVLLVLLAVSVVLLALPVRRAARGVPGARVDPFQAVRVAVLAKASSIVGAAVAGLGTGLIVFLLTRPVPPSVGSMGAVIAAIAGGVLLTAAALVAEQLCTIRKDDDDDQPGPPEPGLGLSHQD